MSSGTHLAFRWLRFNRIAAELALETWYALRRLALEGSRRVLNKARAPKKDEKTTGEPARWVFFVPWVAVLGVFLASYYGFEPVRNVVDTTARAFVEAVREELSPAPEDEGPDIELDPDELPPEDFEEEEEPEGQAIIRHSEAHRAP